MKDINQFVRPTHFSTDILQNSRKWKSGMFFFFLKAWNNIVSAVLKSHLSAHDLCAKHPMWSVLFYVHGWQFWHIFVLHYIIKRRPAWARLKFTGRAEWKKQKQVWNWLLPFLKFFISNKYINVLKKTKQSRVIHHFICIFPCIHQSYQLHVTVVTKYIWIVFSKINKQQNLSHNVRGNKHKELDIFLPKLQFHQQKLKIAFLVNECQETIDNQI